MNLERRIPSFAAAAGTLLLLGGLLTACESTPPPRTTHAPAAAVPPQRVFFYPSHGQTPEQQDRDRYECYNWAVRETGFDPSRRPLVPEQRQAVVPSPSPVATVAGAMTGAVIGAAVAGPYNAGEGALVGGVAGGMLGAAASTAASAEAANHQQAAARDNERRYGREMSDYRRAMSACLEGRGYSVQ